MKPQLARLRSLATPSWLAAALALAAACGKSDRKGPAPTPPAPPQQVSAAPAPTAAPTPISLPPAAPVPTVPAGLPQPPTQDVPVTAERVALGELLFAEPRWSADGKTSCATCHAAAGDFSGSREATALGRPNLRRAPSLSNLAWQRELGWDGRFTRLPEHLAAHLHGQLGAEPEVAVQHLADDPLLRAHFARAGAPAQTEPSAGLALAALAAYAVTRYAGDAPWDQEERAVEHGEQGQALRAGYALFTGKAQCAVCHPPPLYTDLGYHRLGLIASADEGRGRAEPTNPALRGAFKTPGLRGAARRPRFFHDASATSLAAAIDWHLAGGIGLGADRSIIDPALIPVVLTAREREQLLAFVTALTPAASPGTR